MQNLAKKTEDRAENARAFGRSLLEAAVASGLSAQDILARPGMLGGGRGGSQPSSRELVQMPSMQKTNKLQLEPDVAARIGAGKTAYEQPSQTVFEAPGSRESSRTVLKTEVPDPGAAAPSNATTKWHPPQDFEAKLVPPAPTSGVDLTMDDSQLAHPSRAPLPTPTPAPTPAPQIARTRPAPTVAQDGVPQSQIPTVPPAASRVPPSSSRPPSSVDSTMAGDEIPDRVPRTSARAVLIVAACFVVGVLGMSALAYRTGLLGGRPHDPDYATLAVEAAAQQHWESVRDLTDKGLARSPQDAALLRIRTQASTDALAAARAKRDEGDAAGALRLARVAVQLDPASAAASALVDELLAPPEATTTPTEPGVPPLSKGAASGVPASAGGGPRVAVDVSSAHPAIGQPVDLAARVQAGPRAKVEGAAFHIAGPGIAPGTRLEAADGGSGSYRATFAFLQSGRFDVSFTAKVDGAPVRSARAVVVGDGKQQPPQAQPPPLPPGTPTEGPAPGPAPAPTGSVHWM